MTPDGTAYAPLKRLGPSQPRANRGLVWCRPKAGPNENPSHGLNGETPSHGLNGMGSACDVYVLVSGRWRAPRASTCYHRAGGGLSGRRAAEACGCPRLSCGRTEPRHYNKGWGCALLHVGRARPACLRVGRARYRGRLRAAESHWGIAPAFGWARAIAWAGGGSGVVRRTGAPSGVHTCPMPRGACAHGRRSG